MKYIKFGILLLFLLVAFQGQAFSQGLIAGTTVKGDSIEANTVGTAAHPVISWVVDRDTGIYRVGPNRMGITAKGTMVAIADSTGLTVTNLISTGNVSGVWTGTAISTLKGGTGAANAGAARDSLGLTIGTNVQAYSAGLASITTLGKTLIITDYRGKPATAGVDSISISGLTSTSIIYGSMYRCVAADSAIVLRSIKPSTGGVADGKALLKFSGKPADTLGVFIMVWK